MNTKRIAAPLLALLLLGACITDQDEGGPIDVEGDPLVAAPPDFSVSEVYHWYKQQGLDPCEPPPDPWHPFVVEGFCSIQLVLDDEPEAVE